ncbi:MAG: HNH endonuclease [Acidobacteria bacterium]|nr:HNH endonuclease [Acidobacteriota bacterium]
MHDPDQYIRSQAFLAIEQLARDFAGRVPWERIHAGFSARGETIHFANRAKGIFKPRQMSAALSIKTVVPRAGRKLWYEDQESGSDHYDAETGHLRYDLAHGGPDEPTNRFLRLAMERRAPLIYFVGVEPTVYEPIFPVLVEEIRGSEALLSTADSLVSEPPIFVEQARERSYSYGVRKTRRHQPWFSARTKAAYGYRCAFSGLPVRDLLVGAHIVPDEEGGPASIRNGICMSTLHHEAFDSHLVGVDPGFRIHVAPRLMSHQDGYLLAALKSLDKTVLRLPLRQADWPNPEHLKHRFTRFRAING